MTLEKKLGMIRQKYAPKNRKDFSSRQNTVPELQNLYSSLKAKDLPQQILVEENSSTVLPEERNTILDIMS